MVIGLNLDLGVDLDNLTADDIDFSFFEPAEQALDEATTDRPYHSKRPHKKSRAGCKQCKSRKCDEGRPACRACVLRRETCVYPASAPASAASPKAAKASSVASRSPRSSREQVLPASPDAGSSRALVVAEPMFRNGLSDETDMKMLWFYTSETYNSFNVGGVRSDLIGHVLRARIPEYAFTSPFLMQCIMGLSALHLKSLDQDVPFSKQVSYRAKAFEGYRNAIEAARPADHAALLAGSLLMCALSSEMFREADTKPLYIIDWMVVWRGIGLIVEIISPESIQSSGMAVLFYRPPIDLEKTSKYIPNNLLFMVQSIRPGDADYEHQQTYYEVLRYLGALYMELENGFGPIMDLRVITFFTFIPKLFIPLAKQHRPRALIILAHYCAFAKQNEGPWWMLNIADRQIREISESVGESWSHLLRVPRKVMYLEDRTEIAKTILENNSWTDPEPRDPALSTLGLVTDDGREAKLVGGDWQIPQPPLLLAKLQLNDPESENTATQEKAVELIGAAAFGKGHPLNPDTPLSGSTLSPGPISASPARAGCLRTSPR
ncbi:hypothetical protein BJ170DRAFT_573722 [Xylariales sp. AK1849]|nr:hypothetical protein BJ170DRAFT_573722 [Xylariales sp. AK1849]